MITHSFPLSADQKCQRKVAKIGKRNPHARTQRVNFKKLRENILRKDEVYVERLLIRLDPKRYDTEKFIQLVARIFDFANEIFYTDRTSYMKFLGFVLPSNFKATSAFGADSAGNNDKRCNRKAEAGYNVNKF